jgi:decaprenylphosphoryl-5-phosphoribose phosphatase
VSVIASLDVDALRLARTRGHSPRAERAIAAFSALGQHAAIWLALGAAGAALDQRRRGAWKRALGTVTVAYLANTAIKLAVRRPRPQLPGLPPLVGTPTRLSFPSAHATSSFAGALAYERLGLPRAPLYALAAGLAVSRVYLGVHYPSDVLAGAVLGTVVGSVCVRARPPGHR